MSAVITGPRMPGVTTGPVEPRPVEQRTATPAVQAAAPSADGTIEQFDQILPLVTRWLGGMATIWTYTVSHGKLILRLTKPTVKGNLHLTCYDCRRISAPTFWGNTAVQITQEATPEGLRYVLRDDANKVEIRFGYLTAAENVEPVF